MDVNLLALPLAAASAACLATAAVLLARRLRNRTREAGALLEELAEARARTSAIVDAAVDGVVIIDENGIIERFNHAAETIFGYRAADLVGRNVNLLMPEPYYSEHDGYIAAYKATRKPKIIGIGREVTGLRKDGKIFPMDLAVGECRFGGKRLFAGIIRDITDRKKAEQELRDSEAKSRAILETAADAIVTIDGRGTILTVNPATERIFGYPAAEMLGQDISMLIPEPGRAAREAYRKRHSATGGGEDPQDALGRRRDGTVFPAELAVAETLINGSRIFTGIIRDISARKRTEDELRESEERFRLLVDNIRDYAIITLEVDGTIKSWNAGSESLYGWLAEEARGRSISMLYPPGTESEAQGILAQVRETGRYQGENQRMRKDGSRAWVHSIKRPLWDSGGHMRGFVVISRDVTERVAADMTMRAAKEAAEQANIAKTRFLAAASYDLRQPVQALVLYTSVLEERMGDRDTAASVLTHVKGSLAALNGLLEVLLDMSKLEAGSIKPEPTIFALADAIDTTIREFEPSASRKGIRMRAVPTSAVVRTDRALFDRMLGNLVSNAVRYTERGKILVGTRPRGQAVSVQVIDTGIGIPQDRLDDIFQEFVQRGSFERDRDHGAGLGLAFVRRLSRLLGCPVTVRSIVGKGSKFAIELPLVGFSRATNIAYLGLRTRRATAEKARIVIIDDEVTVLQALRIIIADWGYEVIAAQDEDEVMSALRHHPEPPDVIIADYRLRAGQTGAEVIEHIRMRYNHPIPSIVVTGDTAPERIREAEDRGLSLLHKPVLPETLQAEIAKYLG